MALKKIEESEIYQFLSKVGQSSEYATLVGEPTQEEQNFIKNIKVMKYLIFEEPDGVIKLEDKTIIIEHFRIDASEAIIRGNRNRGTFVNKNTKGKPQNFDRQTMLSAVPAGVASVEDLEKNNAFKENLKKYASYEHLCSNFVRSYEEHFSRIDTYKKNILTSCETGFSDNFEITFFVEDVTPIDQQIPNLTKICIEADFLEKQRQNIGYYINKIKNNPVDHIVVLFVFLGKPRVFYASKRMISTLKMLPIEGGLE